ncbi:MAG: hypothetical protein K8R21_07060, partial [Leptospira sp.]|nr:hypothetical protein [Leptospira sp.]
MRAAVPAKFDAQIVSLSNQRDQWITDTYGFHLNGYQNTFDNPDSEYRRGMAGWDDTVSVFRDAEMSWFNSSRMAMQDAVDNPVTGETKFISDATGAIDSLKANILSSEANTANLSDSADKLVSSASYSSAEQLLNQSIVNKNVEASWNAQGSALSIQVINSNARAEAYKKAELDAALRMNEIAPAIYGQDAFLFFDSELEALSDSVTEYTDAQVRVQNDILPPPSPLLGKEGGLGFGFGERVLDAQNSIAGFTNNLSDIHMAAVLKSEVMDKENSILGLLEDTLKKSEQYSSMSIQFQNDGKFEDAAYYLKLSADKKSEAKDYLAKEYMALADFATVEIGTRGLGYTKSSFEEYRDSLIRKNAGDVAALEFQIKKNTNERLGIFSMQDNFADIVSLLDSAKQISKKGNDFTPQVEQLLARSKELANANITGGLLENLNEFISSLEPAPAAPPAASRLSPFEKGDLLGGVKSEIVDLINNMDKVMANQNDFALLSDLMQGADYSLNLAANSALMKYMEETAEKTNAANKERNAELHASLWDGLNNGSDYKYLRDQGYHFEEGSNGIIVAVIQINSGEVKLAGHAMDSSKYSPGKTFQTFSIETKFDPPAIKVGQIDPETFRFSSDLVQGFVDASGDLESMYEKAFAGFSDKSKEVEGKFAQNKEVEDFNNNVYSTGKDKAVSEFIKLAPDMKASYISMVASIKSSYEAQGFKFTENNGILHSEKAVESEISMPTPWGKIPMKVNRGYTKLDIKKDFMLGFLNFNFDVNKNGLGDIYGVINDAYDRFSKYANDALKVEAPKADPWMDVALGMIGQSGSIAQKFTTSAQSYGRNQVTAELARVTGAPLAWVNAITQKGATEKSAFNDYGKSLFFAEVEKNTGIDMSLVQQKIAAKEAKHAMQQTASYQMGNALGAITQATSDLVGGIGIALGVTNRNEYQKTDFAKDSNQEHFARQVYENREVIDTVIDVAAYAVAAAGVAITIVSAGTLAGIGIPMVAYSMASLASYKAVQGAIEGGVVGAITGAANVGNAFTIWYGGAYDVSYSYADGFATSVGFGGKGLGASVHYDDGGGGFGASAGAAFGSVLNAGVNFDSVTGMGANVGIGLGNEGRSGNLGFSYNRNDGFGASLTGNVGQATGGLTYNLRAGVGVTAQYNFAGQTNAHNSTNFGLNYNRADGYTASMDMRGANALSYNQYTGMHANQNYMADAMMNRGLAEEVESDSWLGSIGTALGMNLRTSNQIWNGQ